MVYDIVMPQLSDSMEEGVLVAWKSSVGDKVNIGDVIAEVESDKAIMEVQCFKQGVVSALLIAEGESAPVGTVIATVEIEGAASVTTEMHEVPEENNEVILPDEPMIHSFKRALASPKAKVNAGEKGIDIQALQKKFKLPLPTHNKDIQQYLKRRHFTPKALAVLNENRLDISDFTLDKKYTSRDLLAYKEQDDILRIATIDPFHQALIRNVNRSFEKPVFHIYDTISSRYMHRFSEFSMSAWLVKLIASTLVGFEGFKSFLKGNEVYTYTNVSISFAMLQEKKLYMPVVHNANLLSVAKIQEVLNRLQADINNNQITLSQMQGSCFGISNLGTTGIQRFDALINQDDSAIAAIGSENEEQYMAITLSIDHRLVNGYEAALFMKALKEQSENEEFFTRSIEDV